MVEFQATLAKVRVVRTSQRAPGVRLAWRRIYISSRGVQADRRQFVLFALGATCPVQTCMLTERCPDHPNGIMLSTRAPTASRTHLRSLASVTLHPPEGAHSSPPYCVLRRHEFVCRGSDACPGCLGCSCPSPSNCVSTAPPRRWQVPVHVIL